MTVKQESTAHPHEAKMNEFVTLMAEITNLKSTYEQKLAEYRAKTKEFFGVADGEPINLVQLGKIIIKMGQS